jgi:hypothetical protein
VWYGNADATAYAVTDTYGRNAVWASYVAVWHLQGSYNGTAGEVINSKGALHGTATDAPTQADGKIGKGQTFTKANGNYIEIPDSATSALRLLATKYTIQMWVKPDVGTPVVSFRVIQMEDADDFSGGYAIMYRGVGSILWSHNANDGDRNWTFSSGMSDGTFYKADFVYDQTNRKYYRDGGYIAQKATNANLLSDNNDVFNIGRVPVYGQYYNGDLDEIRVIADALSSDWIATEYANQSAPATFITEGTEEDVGNTSVTITPDALALTSVINDGTISTVRNITTILSVQSLTSSVPTPTINTTINTTVTLNELTLTSSQPNCTVYPLAETTTASSVIYMANRDRIAIKLNDSGTVYLELD